MMKFIRLLNWLPIFHLSADQNFGTIEKDYDLKETKKMGMRFSLIYLELGALKYYFITYSFKKRKFAMKQVFSIDQYFQTEETMNRINKACEKQRNHLENLENSSEIELEINFIKYKMEQQEGREAKSSEKMNTYNYLFLVLAPATITFWLYFISYGFNIYFDFMIGIVFVYDLVNIYFYIMQFNKVRSFTRTKYGTIKNAKNKLIEIALGYYEDWQKIKDEADELVSYPKNLQHKFNRLLLLLVICGILISYTELSKKMISYRTEIEAHTLTDMYTVKWESECISEKSLDELESIQHKLKTRTYNEMIIVMNQRNKLADIKINTLEGLMSPFNLKPTKIFFINDETVDINVTKIYFIGVKK